MLNVQLDRGPISGVARAMIFVLLLGVTAIVAAAQSGLSTFSGTISDESGRGIPDTAVTLTNEARRAKYEVKTNGIGSFEFVGLPAGDYTLEATGRGFRALREAVAVTGQNLQRHYTLRLGTLTETVTVTDDGSNSGQSAIKEVAPPAPVACTPSSSGGQIKPPKKIRDFAPAYPASLRGTGTSHVVILSGRIALDGYITDISVLREGHPELANAAVAAVREWKFTETLLNCQPVDVFMTINVNFKGATPAP